MTNELFTKRGISLERLMTLVLVADKGSIAEAAGRQDLNRQSLFSRQLKELEACFECTLTERRGRTLTLTPAGRQLATLAREHFLALQRFDSDHGKGQSVARIGAGESLLNWLVIPGLARLPAADSGFCWETHNLQAEHIQERLLDQRLDFGIVRAPGSSPRLRHTVLGMVETMMFVPQGLCPKDRPPVVGDIPSLPLAMLEGMTTVRQALEGKFARRGPLDIRYACTTAVQVASYIGAGLAAGPLPALARNLFAGMQVAAIPLSPLLPKDKPLSLVWSPRTLAMSLSLDQLREELASALRAMLTPIK